MSFSYYITYLHTDRMQYEGTTSECRWE